MNKKFEKIFQVTKGKMGKNGQIDFEKSDINHKPTQKVLHRTKKIQTHLSEIEFNAFIDTLDLLENRSERVRNLILNDIKYRQKKAQKLES